MIYTCTTNPSLDYYINLTEDLKKDSFNRSDKERFEAGGKGVNVSCVLNNINIPSICLGFLGGFTQEYYLEHLKAYKQLQPLFTTIEGNTRINIKVIDGIDVTDFNANGPEITSNDFKKFEKRLNSIYSNDYFILSGNIQKSIEDDIVRVVHELSDSGVKIILDCNLEVIKRCAECHPFLIRFNHPDIDEEDRNKYAKELIKLGVKNILYSYFNKPYFLYTENEIYSFDDVDPNKKYVAGTSETLIAGYLYGMLRGANPYESFKYACATIKTTSVAANPIDNSIIENKYNEVEVKRIKV